MTGGSDDYEGEGLQFQCEQCGASVIVDEPALGALAPEVMEVSRIVQCDEHSPAFPMRRVA